MINTTSPDELPRRQMHRDTRVVVSERIQGGLIKEFGVLGARRSQWTQETQLIQGVSGPRV